MKEIDAPITADDWLRISAQIERDLKEELAKHKAKAAEEQKQELRLLADMKAALATFSVS